MKRRDFLKCQIMGVLAPALAGPELLLSNANAAETPPDVAAVTGAPEAATRAAVDMLGGMGRFVKKNDKVVIKPNMSFADPAENGTNTRPEVIRELVIMCREAGAQQILVLDNPLSDAGRCLEQSGIAAACADLDNTRVMALKSSRHYQEAPIPEGRAMRENVFMRDVLEADVLIAAPTAKSHSSAGVSLALKGMMGLIRDRGVLHRLGLDQSIVDLNTLLKADLTVVDAGYVLTTGGPFGPGEVHKEDMVIASADPVAADAYAVQSFTWYGNKYRPDQVPHIKLAHEQGLGRMDLDSLRIETRKVG